MSSESAEVVDEPELVTDAARRLVLVTGAGRSGTSTVAGSLHHLGLYVPLPVLDANESNPRGFFESTWPLKFHKEILARAFVDPFDARPEAVSHMSGAVGDDDRARLRDWLHEQAGNGPQLVVKDPRSSWVTGLWSEVARDENLGIGYVAMLRHPAEVVGSRATYYGANHDADWVRRYQVVKLAGWVNANLLVERQTRGQRRTFVRYNELIEDWREAMTRVRADLDLRFNADPMAGKAHAVDGFIDPDLRRIRVTWDELDVPDGLRETAEEVWEACCALAEAHGSNDETQVRLDAAGERYASLYKDAQAIARDTIAAESKKAAQQARAKMRKKVTRAKAAAQDAQAIARPRRRSVIERATDAARRRVHPR